MNNKRAILLVNLGSPDAPTTTYVRRYLREFLMDPRVIDIPTPLRFALVNFIIAPFRAPKSAKAYQQIWQREGSPLVVTSQKVQFLLQAKLDYPVELAMRYGRPSIPATLKTLVQNNRLQEIFLIPLYPHYAMSSYETCVVQVKKALNKLRPDIRLNVQQPFYDDQRYIHAMAENAKPYLEKEYDHLLFSYHGLPVRHLTKTDPTGTYCQANETCCSKDSKVHSTCYRAQAFKTMQSFVQKTGIPEGKYSLSFQSRLGQTPWLQPYTDVELTQFPARGIKKLVVICPSFVSDCLETLEEINIRGRESFLQAGGKELTLIPCLNQHPLWIDTLSSWSTSN